MNRCTYCGRENEDTQASCSGCGTPFAREEGPPSRSIVEVLRSPTGMAISTSLAVLLLCGGIFFLVGSLTAELSNVRGMLPPERYPGTRRVVFSRWPTPVVALAAAVPVVALYRARFAPKSRSNRLVSLTLCGLGALAAAPYAVPYVLFLWCPLWPVLLSFGVPACYAGASVQVLGAGFFIYWLRPGSKDDSSA